MGPMARLKNEYRVLRGHPIIWLSVLAATAFGALAAYGTPFGVEEGAGRALVWFNVLYPMFVLPFVAGAIAPIVFVREVDHGLGEMIGSYPLSVREWLVARIASLTVLLLLANLLSQIAFAIVILNEFPGGSGILFRDSLKWLAVLQVPNCLLWASILAWISAKKANAGFVYITAGLLWLGYNVLATISGSEMIAGGFVAFEPLRNAMTLLDPYAGFSLIHTLSESGALNSATANVIASRIFWLGAALLLVAGIRNPPLIPKSEMQPSSKAASKTGSGRLPNHIALHLRFVAADRVFPLLVIGWLALLIPEVVGGMDWVETYSRVSPDSRDALNRVMWDAVIGGGTALTIYMADRVCRLYSISGMHELYAATPHHPRRLIMTQLVSLFFVAFFFVALAGAAVLVCQLILQSPIQPAEYAKQTGLVWGKLALFGGVLVAVHGLIRQRAVANLVGLFLFLLDFSPLLATIGLHHPLWHLLATPLSSPDHFWGFSGSLKGHWHFTALWMTIGAATLIFASLFHNRLLPFKRKPSFAVARRPAFALALVWMGAAALQAHWMHDRLSDEGALVQREELLERRATYERRYAHWADRAQPEVEVVDAQVDFYPARQEARLSATMLLVNRSSFPIRQILVGRNSGDNGTGQLTLDGEDPTKIDDDAGQVIFTLDQPLFPGDRVRLEFGISIRQSGLSPASYPVMLRPEFSSLPAFNLLPMIGFRREFTLWDPENRAMFDLPPLDLTPPSRLVEADVGDLSGEEAMINSIISTEATHFALGQGELVDHRIEGDRAFFHYRTDQPIRNLPAYFSSPVSPEGTSQGSVTAQIIAPAPVRADDLNMLGMLDTIAWLEDELAPYPGSTLSLVAIPELGVSGFALPQLIQVSHKQAFRAEETRNAGFNQVYRRAVHETAHQWFGHMLGYGNPKERAFLIESLAKYAELVMIERRYGTQTMEALVAYENERYRQGRGNDFGDILPLIDAEEGIDQYSRATVAFACLRSIVGDEPIMGSLRQLRQLSEDTGRAVRSREFVSALISRAPSNQSEIETMLLGTIPLNDALRSAGC